MIPPLLLSEFFVPFALSQTGMIRHWKKEKGSHFLKSAFANILGAINLLRYRPYSTPLQAWRYLAILPNYPSLNLPLFVHPQSYQKVAKTTSTL